MLNFLSPIGVHLNFSGHYRGINELEKVGLSGRLLLSALNATTMHHFDRNELLKIGRVFKTNSSNEDTP
jgi:hypothetical protein